MFHDDDFSDPEGIYKASPPRNMEVGSPNPRTLVTGSTSNADNLATISTTTSSADDGSVAASSTTDDDNDEQDDEEQDDEERDDDVEGEQFDYYRGLEFVPETAPQESLIHAVGATCEDKCRDAEFELQLVRSQLRGLEDDYAEARHRGENLADELEEARTATIVTKTALNRLTHSFANEQKSNKELTEALLSLPALQDAANDAARTAEQRDRYRHQRNAATARIELLETKLETATSEPAIATTTTAAAADLLALRQQLAAADSANAAANLTIGQLQQQLKAASTQLAQATGTVASQRGRLSRYRLLAQIGVTPAQITALENAPRRLRSGRTIDSSSQPGHNRVTKRR